LTRGPYHGNLALPMSSWRKVKGLFWQSGEPEQSGAEELSDAEFQELLSSQHAVPEAPVVPVDPSTVPITGHAGAISIDFQSDYDAVGIPNTDEVEQLERFLGGLDANLPQASKLAAAKAFLNAVGKSVDDVLRDAERKIERVRAIRAGHERSTQQALAAEQAEIEQLNQAIEEKRSRMQALSGDLEGVRHACLIEESRLQAAHVFFGQASGKVSSQGS
jgi:hypothetical protein